MSKLASVVLIALALTQPAGAQSTTDATKEKPLLENPLLKHRAELIAQCPPPIVVSDVDAAKLPIHVTRWGEAGPDVLIVHGGVQGGLGGGPSTFAKQEALAGNGWRVSVVDRPGFGKSPTRGVDDMERDSHWIADMLGDGANLIGHSWGGAEALLAAARRPHAVHSLILIEPAMQMLLVGDPSVEANPAAKAGAAKFPAMLMGAKTPQDYALAFAGSLGAKADDPAAPNAAAAQLKGDPELAKRVGCSLLQARMAPPDVLRKAAATVAEAGIPVLVVSGGWSPLFDAVSEIAAKLTHGRHVVVRSPNHFVQQESAEEFNKVVDSFMRAADMQHGSNPH